MPSRLGSQLWIQLDHLSPQTIEALLAEKGMKGRLLEREGVGPASVRTLQVTLHKALDAAVRKGLLTRNPAEGVSTFIIDAGAMEDDLLANSLAIRMSRLVQSRPTALMGGWSRSETSPFFD